MRTKVVVAAVTVGALIVALVITRCVGSSKVMTEEDRAAIEVIAEKDRRDTEIISTKVDAWNKAKDSSVATFNFAASAKVHELEAAIEEGDWDVLKGYLEDTVAATMDARGAATTVHGADVRLAYEPLAVPDIAMRIDPHFTWEEWEPGGWPYSEYADTYVPAFADSKGELFSADGFAPEPWTPPETISVKGSAGAGDQFQLSVENPAGLWLLGLDDLLAVPGLVDPDSPIATDGSVVVAQKDAAARAMANQKVSAWNAAKNTALDAYNTAIQSRIDPAKVDTIETALETGDWTTLEPFLDPAFAAEMSQGDWFKQLQEFAGDELRDPGITLVYQPLRVDDLEPPDIGTPITLEEWCTDHDCDAQPYSEYAKDYDPTLINPRDGSQYTVPQPWVAPNLPATVTLTNPEGWLDIYLTVRLDTLQ